MSTEAEIITLLSGDYTIGDGVTIVYEGETPSIYLENPEQYSGFLQALGLVNRKYQSIDVGENTDYDEAQEWADLLSQDRWNTSLSKVLELADKMHIDYEISQPNNEIEEEYIY